MEHWFSADRKALVGFVRSKGFAIVAGAPICSPETLESVVQEWEKFVDKSKLKTCYFGAEARLINVLSQSKSHSSIDLGAQPEWSPQSFVKSIQSHPSLRAQINRAKNKNIKVNEWPYELAENHPELQKVLDKWLKTRGLPPLHFLVEYQTLGNLKDRRIFVATIHDKVIGFVTLCPSPARNGWLTEQFVRSPIAPNGTIEFLLQQAALTVLKDKATYFTMGIVPLIRENTKNEIPESRLLKLIRFWANAHLTRFYNFKGLKQFKAKFFPDEWKPVVVYVKDKKFRISHLVAIANAFTQVNPIFALAQGIARAVTTEFKTISKNLNP